MCVQQALPKSTTLYLGEKGDRIKHDVNSRGFPRDSISEFHSPLTSRYDYRNLRDILVAEEVELLDFFASSADVVGIRPG